jgi:hypothetical protein
MFDKPPNPAGLLGPGGLLNLVTTSLRNQTALITKPGGSLHPVHQVAHAVP